MTRSRPRAPAAATSTFCVPPEARDYLAEVRERALDVTAERGVGDGLVHELIIRHEQQHNETMLQTLLLAQLFGLRVRQRRHPTLAPAVVSV